MRSLTLNANTTYNVSLNANSSILIGTTLVYAAGTMNVASGGTSNDLAQNNIFGGRGGLNASEPTVAYSGSGYGAGGGGGFNPAYPIHPFGGGGGFDPNIFYNLPANAIQGVPISDQTATDIDSGKCFIGIGKPPVLFLEVTKP
jgi:hypothetical protein